MEGDIGQKLGAIILKKLPRPIAFRSRSLRQTRSGSRWLAAFLVLVMPLSSAHAENQHIKEAKTMRAAFRCSLWAGSTGDLSESTRLLELGFREGTRYLEAATKDATLQFNVPEVLRGKVTGAYNKDFEMGRLYEAVFAEANAMLLNAALANDEASTAMKAVARSQFINENCSILR
ncbi:hypothetical protein GOA98_09025 [Sinorhizobium meliloti]|nr:hypothetical protein [Sinorhizobium meliloti]